MSGEWLLILLGFIRHSISKSQVHCKTAKFEGTSHKGPPVCPPLGCFQEGEWKGTLDKLIGYWTYLKAGSQWMPVMHLMLPQCCLFHIRPLKMMMSSSFWMPSMCFPTDWTAMCGSLEGLGLYHWGNPSPITRWRLWGSHLKFLSRWLLKWNGSILDPRETLVMEINNQLFSWVGTQQNQ